MYSIVHTLSFYTHYALATVGYDFLDSVRQLYTQGFYWISIGWIFFIKHDKIIDSKWFLIKCISSSNAYKENKIVA